MIFGCTFMVFAGGGGVLWLWSLGRRLVCFSAAVGGWLGFGWGEGAHGGGGASLSGGGHGGFPSEGSRMGLPCLLKGGCVG